MANILNIETSTSVCSVALTSNGEVLEHRENYEGQTHATLLSAYIQDIMRYATSRDIKLDAIAVSIGPRFLHRFEIGLSKQRDWRLDWIFHSLA